MTPYIIAAAFAGGLAAGGLGAYTYQSAIYGAKIAGIEAEQANALSEAYTKTQAVIDINHKKDREAVEALSELQKVNEQLRASHSGPDKRLRISATCMPTDPTATGVDANPTAELSAATGQDVFDLRGQLTLKEAMLSYLQGYAADLQRLSPTKKSD